MHRMAYPVACLERNMTWWGKVLSTSLQITSMISLSGASVSTSRWYTPSLAASNALAPHMCAHAVPRIDPGMPLRARSFTWTMR